MRVTMVGEKPLKWSPHAEIWNALRALPPGGDQLLLGYGPVATMNPYQTLLYQGFGDQRIAVPRLHEFIHLEALVDYSAIVAKTALHLHWLHGVTKTAASATEARTFARRFVEQLTWLRERGVGLVWTVHNAYPHDAKFVEEDLALQQQVADAADVVHVMSRGSVEMLEGLTTVRESSVVVSPHPSYRGAYEHTLDRATARAMLGLSHDDVVLVAFGAIKPYKGLRELRCAFEAAARGSEGARLKLLVAGGADKSPEAREFVDWATLHPQVLIEPKPVAAAHTQVFLRAADVGLAAYRRNLNSGAALLYLSFGLPVIAVDTPVLRESLPGRATSFVAEIDSTHYAEALTRAGQLRASVTEQEVVASIAHLEPEKVSREFASELRQRLLS